MHRAFASYLAAHGGKSLIWHAYDLLFAYFLTQHLHVSPSAMGFITMVLMAFGAVLDPLAGLLIGSGPDTAARYARLQLYGAVISTGTFSLLFSYALPLAPEVRAVVIGLLFQVAYKLYDIPQNALTSLLSQNRNDVLQLSTSRYFLSATARILVAFAAMLLVDGSATSSGASSGVFLFTALLCIPALATSFLFYVALPHPTVIAHSRDAFQHRSVRHSFNGIPKGMPILLAASFVHAGLVSMMPRMLPYLEDSASVLVCFSIGTLVFLPLLHRVALCYGEHVAFVLSSLLSALPGVAIARTFGDAEQVPLLPLFAFLYGGGIFGSTMLLWATAANLIHYHQRAFGIRSDAVAYGFFTFSSKIGIALALALLGYILNPIASGQSAADAESFCTAAWLTSAGTTLSLITIFPMMHSLHHQRLKQ